MRTGRKATDDILMEADVRRSSGGSSGSGSKLAQGYAAKQKRASSATVPRSLNDEHSASTLEAQLQKLREEQADALQAEVQMLEQELKEATESNTTLKARVRGLQDDVQSLEAENFSLDQRCSSLQMQQEKLAKEFHQSQAELKACRDQINAAASAANATSEIYSKALSESVCQSMRTLGMVKGVSGPLDQAAAELQASQARLEASEARLQQQADEAATACAALVSELCVVRAEGEAKLTAMAEEMQLQGEASRRERERLVAELDAARLEAVKACGWAERMAAEMALLQDRGRDLQGDAEAARGDAAAARGDSEAARQDAAAARQDAHAAREAAAAAAAEKVAAVAEACLREQEVAARQRRSEQGAVEKAALMVSQLRVARAECEARRREAEEAIAMLKREVRDAAAQTDCEGSKEAAAAASFADATTVDAGEEEAKDEQGSEIAAVPVAVLAAAEARSAAAEAVAGSRQAEVDLLRRALSGAQAQLAVLRGLVEQLQSRRAQENGACWGSEGGAAAALVDGDTVMESAAVEDGAAVMDGTTEAEDPKLEGEEVAVPDKCEEAGVEVAPVQERALKKRRPGPLRFMTALVGRTVWLGMVGVAAVAFSRTPHGVRVVEAVEARAGAVRWHHRSLQEHEAHHDDDGVGDSIGAADTQA